MSVYREFSVGWVAAAHRDLAWPSAPLCHGLVGTGCPPYARGACGSCGRGSTAISVTRTAHRVKTGATKTLWLCLALFAALCVNINAAVHAATTERLDDSLSPRSSVAPMLATTNGSVFDGAAPTEGSMQFGWVEYRLNTAKFIGKAARIYYVVPAAIINLRSPRGLRVDWRGRNVFSSGSARPGERVLVWSGVVKSVRMEDALDLKMVVLLSEMQSAIRFESYFEIEVN